MVMSMILIPSRAMGMANSPFGKKRGRYDYCMAAKLDCQRWLSLIVLKVVKGHLLHLRYVEWNLHKGAKRGFNGNPLPLYYRCLHSPQQLPSEAYVVCGVDIKPFLRRQVRVYARAVLAWNEY